MTATNTTEPALDGTGAPFTAALATESVSTAKAAVAYLKKPSDESLVNPATADLQAALNGDGGSLVHVQNFPSSVAVTGTFWQATQPVSGTVTVNFGTIGSAATAANQTSQITQETASATALGTPADAAWVSGSGSLIAISKKIAAAGGGAVSIADGASVTQGAIADVAYVSGSGTVVAILKGIFAKLSAALGVTQSGTWTVQPGNTANTTAWKVDGSAVTQPVSGTVTANAGTNLNTSTLALENGGNLATIAASKLAQGSTTAGQGGNLQLGAVTTAAPAYTTAQTSPLSLNTAGALRVDGSGFTQPVSGSLAIGGSASVVGDGLISGGASAAVPAAPGGSSTHNYVPADTITLTDGAPTTHAVLTVTHTQVVAAAVVAGGTGGTPGAVTITGTTGTGTKFQATGTITGGGALSGALVVTVAGDYTVNPTTPTAEPVTGGGLTGCTVNIFMGVLTVSVTTAGVVTAIPANPVAQASSSGAGTGATFTVSYAAIAQTIFGATVPVNGWKINNPSNVSDIWASDSGVTPVPNGAGSIMIPQGGGNQYSTEVGEKPSGSAVKVIGTTIGQPFVARRW